MGVFLEFQGLYYIHKIRQSVYWRQGLYLILKLDSGSSPVTNLPMTIIR